MVDMPAPNVSSAAIAVHMNIKTIRADNGYEYSLIGYVIESLNIAYTDDEYKSALELLRKVVASPDTDIFSPCWTDYYPPLEYLCVLHKVRLGNNDVAEIARSIARAGAKLHPEMFVGNDNMVEHAKKILEY